jgi:ABC-2 type transport system ATP-binding protein
MITAVNLTKRYHETVAVDALSFVVEPGRVTGFLGPNGAGKSTTMRLILGLDEPTGGRALVDGQPYRELDSPLRSVGALLDANAVDPNRSGRNHLAWLAVSNRIDARRIDQVLELVGLEAAADRRVGGYSLGMHQRLGLAAALLGDPATLLLDEPMNGLDPEGIVWLRGFVRQLAEEGRTVFLSSHLMTEMALTADHVIVVAHGRLVADSSVKDLIGGAHAHDHVRVAAGQRRHELATVLVHHGGLVAEAGGAMTVTGLDAAAIGEIAATSGIALTELTPERASLEEAFIEMTRDPNHRADLVGADAGA